MDIIGTLKNKPVSQFNRRLLPPLLFDKFKYLIYKYLQVTRKLKMYFNKINFFNKNDIKIK